VSPPNLDVIQLLYIFLPLLIPLGLSVAVLRLSWASHNSRARIKLLEKDDSNRQKLIHILANLEKRMEDAVADLIDDPSPDGDTDSLPTTANPQTGKPDKITLRGNANKMAVPQILTPLQVQIAVSLNGLPHLKKERAYIQGVRNSHAPVVCRDPKRFPFHRVGEGVIRHWADHFDV